MKIYSFRPAAVPDKAAAIPAIEAEKEEAQLQNPNRR